jgi:glycine/D-amino acid oxidase-like deaminating enzyme
MVLGALALMTFDALIIGGGFYGLHLAEYMAARVPRVLLCERSTGLMQRASFVNQARVHNGYHYPRSILTAVRSRVNFHRFLDEFSPAIDSTYDSVYAVGRHFSKVSSAQFYQSVRRFGAPIRPAPDAIKRLFAPTFVEDVFLTEECAFNSTILRGIMSERVRRAGAEVATGTTVLGVSPAPGNAVRVDVDGPEGPKTLIASHVFCCAYAQLNGPGVAGGLAPVRLKHELAEIVLVEPPEQLVRMGITIMDGPFFSLMPFPAKALHALYHVRYSPHAHWYDGAGTYRPAYGLLESADKQTAYRHMVRDAARYVPLVADCRRRESLWDVRTVLPLSETDDSRPILFKPHFGMPNYHLVMGGKIDNVYDIIDVVSRTFPDLSS